jgi:hypothetical protein
MEEMGIIVFLISIQLMGGVEDYKIKQEERLEVGKDMVVEQDIMAVALIVLEEEEEEKMLLELMLLLFMEETVGQDMTIQHFLEQTLV